jgi:hypothetical protein
LGHYAERPAEGRPRGGRPLPGDTSVSVSKTLPRPTPGGPRGLHRSMLPIVDDGTLLPRRQHGQRLLELLRRSIGLSLEAASEESIAQLLTVTAGTGGALVAGPMGGIAGRVRVGPRRPGAPTPARAGHAPRPWGNERKRRPRPAGGPGGRLPGCPRCPPGEEGSPPRVFLGALQRVT